MRKFKVTVSTPPTGSDYEDFFEVSDDATENEIEKEAREVADNMIEWRYEELEE